MSSGDLVVKQKQGLLLASGFPAAAQSWCLRSPEEGLGWDLPARRVFEHVFFLTMGVLGMCCQAATDAVCIKAF